MLTLPLASGDLPTATVGSPATTPTAVPAADAFLAQVDADAGSLRTASAGDTLHEGARILVVDDEPINRQVLRNFLSVENFDLTLAESGDEALRLLETQTFDLVLLDVMMPRLSGYEVCRALRENHPMLPICCGCKKIRDDAGYWSELELYIDNHSEARFSHGICPDCAETYYGDILS